MVQCVSVDVLGKCLDLEGIRVGRCGQRPRGCAWRLAVEFSDREEVAEGKDYPRGGYWTGRWDVVCSASARSRGQEEARRFRSGAATLSRRIPDRNKYLDIYSQFYIPFY